MRYFDHCAQNTFHTLIVKFATIFNVTKLLITSFTFKISEF